MRLALLLRSARLNGSVLDFRSVGRWFTAVLVLVLWMAPARTFAEGSVCARVRIEIPQELTLERQGFEARMTIHNGVLGVPLENISVDLLFSDAQGQPVLATSDPNNVSAKFFLRLQTGSSIPSTVPGENSARITWLIIPAPGAGGANPQGQMYSVGATLRYRAGGQNYEVSVSPDTIFVKPMPLLLIDYFLPREVYGDEPFTPAVEPPVPYSLGVRVANTGHGLAKNVRIESGQPTIVDNQQGLLVDFRIAGTEVNGQSASSSLLCNFGDIPANRSGVGRWTMTSSLSGRFTEFSAYYTHADDLGGKLTSLIDGTPRTHVLVWNVAVDLPGRDGVRDFLARDGNTLSVFESDNLDSPVADQSSSALLNSAGGSLAILPQPVSGFLYVQKPDPYDGGRVIVQARRSDGKTLNAANAWFSKTFDYTTKKWVSHVNLFDVNNPTGHSYTLTLAAAPGTTNRPPVFDALTNRTIVAGATHSFQIGATDPDNDALAFSSPQAIAAGAILNAGTGQFTWQPTEAQVGQHQFAVTVTDNGQPPQNASATLTIVVTSATNEPPVITLSTNKVLYAEGDGAVLLDAEALIEDADSPVFENGTLSVTITTGRTPADLLSLQDQTVSEPHITVTQESEVMYGTEAVGTLSVLSDGTNVLTVAFNESATLAAVQAVVRQVAFANTNIHSLHTNRTIQYLLTDGHGGSSDFVNLQVMILPENQAPIAANYAAATTVNTPIILYLVKILANARDPDGDPLVLGLPDNVTTGGGTVAQNQDSVAYSPHPALIGNDEFRYRVTDPFGASTEATVTVFVRPNTGTQNTLNVQQMQDGSMRVRMLGIANRTYTVHRSTDLTGWTEVRRVTAGTNGIVEFLDEALSEPQRFYRLTYP